MKPDAKSKNKLTEDTITGFSDKELKSKLNPAFMKMYTSEDENPVSKKTRTENEKLLRDETIREESIERDDKVKRSKGEGEEGDGIYQRFTPRTILREDAVDMEESLKRSVATQINPKLMMSPSNRTKPKMFMHLKINKVDPVDDPANVSDESCVFEGVTSGMTHAIRTIQEDELAETSDPVEHQLNACRCELRKSSKSASNSAKRYTTIFMSNLKDAYYCEFCRPYKSCGGSISKHFDIAELKKLRCASCKFSFYERCNEVCTVCKQRKRVAPSSK